MKLKLLYVGTLGKVPDRDSFWVEEFKKIGWEVETFSSRVAFNDDLISKFKNRLNLGSEVKIMQKRLLAKVKIYKPHWVHFRLPKRISKSTLEEMKMESLILTQYYNDDPFAKKPLFISRRFLKALKSYDINFVWRKVNVHELKILGSKQTFHCPPCYDEKSREFIKHNEEFSYDAIFIGHFEKDNRLNYLLKLNNNGFKIGIWGSYWDNQIKNTKLSHLSPIKGKFGKEYNYLYVNCLAGLCFFSKINRDQWTRRPFEIVSVGGLLVCERTDEAMSYFEDKKEAYFFSDFNELQNIIILLKSNPEIREKVREAGYRRLKRDRHTFRKRAQFIHSKVFPLVSNLQKKE